MVSHLSAVDRFKSSVILQLIKLDRAARVLRKEKLASCHIVYPNNSAISMSLPKISQAIVRSVDVLTPQQLRRREQLVSDINIVAGTTFTATFN